MTIAYLLFWFIFTAVVVASVVYKESHPACRPEMPQDDFRGIPGPKNKDRRLERTYEPPVKD